ncbi:MAG: TlpA disulfide reductase family protein [Actinomycetota bacterium]|nr:TlpA disulfide reductase family protein [Actinomycetota bacterium]
MNPVRAAAVAVGLVVALLVVVFATRDAGPDRLTTHLVGAVAPPVLGTTVDGEAWDLDDQRGRWVLVNFFSTTCVPCVEEHPELVAFSAAHGPVGERVGSDAGRPEVRLVSVAFDDRASAVADFFAANGGGWPVLAADTGRIAVDWGVVAVPESYLVTPSGYVAAKVVGGVVRADLEELLDRASSTLADGFGGDS